MMLVLSLFLRICLFLFHLRISVFFMWLLFIVIYRIFFILRLLTRMLLLCSLMFPTPRQFLKTIYQIDKGTATDNNDTLAGAEYMYRLLKMQTRKNKIPAQMPSEVKVANKTGELDHVENDAGIIYDTAKGIDLVVCFMSQDLNDTSAAQNTIAQDSRAIYGYYNE